MPYIKKTLFVIAFLFASFDGMTQSFAPEDAYWFVQSRQIHSRSPGVISRVCEDKTISVIGDTLVDDQTFQKLKIDNLRNVHSNVNMEDWSTEYGWLKYNSGKVSFGSSMDDMQLLYDFNLEVGDTFVANYKYLGHSLYDTVFVETVDSIFIGDVYRKRIILNDVDWMKCFSETLQWVEGVGDLYVGLLYHTIDFANCPLLTIAQGDSLDLIDKELLSYPCEIAPIDSIVPIEPFVYSEHLVYPNPFINEIVIQYDKEDFPPFSIYDMNGKIVFKENLNFGNNTFNLSHLASGVYTLSIRIEEGDEVERIVKLN